MLALALVGLLLGIAIVNFGAFGGGRALEEATWRLETALRMARAEAANQGRRLRIAFGEEDGRFYVLWEPDPLAAPGKFAEYAACTWDDYVSMDGVVVERCELVGPSYYQAMDASSPAGALPSGTASGLAAVTFEPDGSSDSAVIELSATDAADSRRAVIELEGLTGTVTSRILSPEELEGSHP
jgi:type II secretory pathway pseudopilin PulG